jgi:hypothetical protein
MMVSFAYCQLWIAIDAWASALVPATVVAMMVISATIRQDDATAKGAADKDCKRGNKC